MVNRKVVLGILDGWGIGPIWGGNGIANSNTPTFTNLWAKYPHTQLTASGKAVGLSGHEMGNSEVGHFTIGAGRITSQDATQISNSITNKSFFHNKALLETISYCKGKGKPIHLMGLLTEANVHASLDHIFALLDLLKLSDFRQPVLLHIFTDGRDSPPESALLLLEKLLEKIKNVGIGKIATICGRYYAMDRSGNERKIQPAFDCISKGKGARADSARKAIADAYQKGLTDEYIEPTNIIEENLPIGLIKQSSAVIFFNFRQDRAREITKYLARKISRLRFVSFVPYKSYDMPKNVTSCFSLPNVKNNLTEVISRNGLSQIHIAESEKFAHITYFFNGGTRAEFARERRIKIPSLPPASYYEFPKMKVDEITQKVIQSIDHKYDFILFNFANADMVGHIGRPEAVTKAIEAIDQNLAKIVSKCQINNYNLIITADHGNAEELINPKTGEASSTHSTNPVPIIIMPNNNFPINSDQIYSGWGLSSIAPTILQIMGIAIPPEMTSPSLIKKVVAPTASESIDRASHTTLPIAPIDQTQKLKLQNPSPIKNIR